MIDRLLALIDRLCMVAARLAMAALLVLFFLGLAELVFRNLADISLPFAVEYAGYLVAIVLLLGSGEALRTGGHIRVSLLMDRLNERQQQILDVLATVLGLITAGFFAWALIDYALTTLLMGTRSYYPSETPLAWPQMALALGPMILVLAFLARLIRLIRGDALVAEAQEETP